jgi:SPP1 gp7 family putative phage head morphogenesis protein
MRSKRIDYEILLQFREAAKDLLKVYQEQQRYKELRSQSRKFYQGQKTRTLEEFSRYEFLFSENYLRLTESGSLSSYPDFPHVQVNLIFLDGVMSGQSYQDTYREIAREFDRMIREASYDPTLSDRLITSYEKELIEVYNDFGSGCVDIIRENFGNPAEISTQIDKFQTKLMKSVRKMLKKQVPKFWQQGIDWAEINIQQAKKKKKEDAINIPSNQAAIDALIERNLSYVKGLTEDQKKSILAELIDGMLKGEGIDQLVKRLAPYVDAGSGKGQSRAELIARTEVMYGLNQGALNRYDQDGIEKVQWLAGPDDRMCAVCGQKNGSVYNIKTAPSLPHHPDCRCVWIPVI